ncbi:MAG: hypothetical protein U0270_15225 [Labilithrix sp.]
MTPLERLRLRTDIASVDAEGAREFAHREARGLLLLPGDPTRPEVIDLAVVVSELHQRHPDLRIAIADSGHEAVLRERLHVTSFPSLVFVKDGAVAKVLSRMQSWATYLDALASLEASS